MLLPAGLAALGTGIEKLAASAPGRGTPAGDSPWHRHGDFDALCHEPPGQIPFSFWTIVIGHATFCVVTVYNNVLARFRRSSGSIVEASMDLGANGFQTFWHVILPGIATALLASGILAFSLSFDEVIVTTFTAGQQQTLPIWLYSQMLKPRNRPIPNVTAMLVVLITALPIVFAQRLIGRSAGDTTDEL